MRTILPIIGGFRLIAAADSGALPPWFLGVAALWIALGFGLFAFYRKASYQAKKAAHPFIMVGVGVLMLGVAEFLMHGHMPLVFVIAIAIVTILNTRLIRFCPSCNATVNSQGFSGAKSCPKCGADLEKRT